MQISPTSPLSASALPEGALAAAPRQLTVFYPMAGDTMGGSHVSLLGLLEGLDPSQVRILIGLEVPHGRLAAHYAKFEQVADPAPPARSFDAGARFGPLSVLRTLRGLKRRRDFLMRNDIDIVHTNDGRTHATWALAAKLARKRLVWHHRGSPDARGVRLAAPWLADRIITVSSFALPAQPGSLRRKASVVYSPFDVSVTVDRAAMRKLILAEFDLPDDAVICGFFGTFIPRKRPQAFVEAIDALSAISSRPVKGLLFGEATNAAERSAIRRSIEGSKGRVEDAGYRTPGHEWIGGCDLLLVPAVDEPLGRTLVEAMLVGTPVIATHSGGNPEALANGCGVLVPDLDPASMAQAASDLLADRPRLEAMVARAMTAARTRFSRERHVGEIMETYRALTVRRELVRT